MLIGRKYNNIIPIIIATVIIAILAGVVIYSIRTRSHRSITQRAVEQSAWVVDWQWQPGVESLKAISDSLSSVQVFAAYFDHNDKLYLTDDFIKALPEISEAFSNSKAGGTYITIVNDRFDEKGQIVQKDSKLVTRLTATKQSRKRHIDELVEMIIKWDFDGVEIDYEKIEDNDWTNFIAFCSELYQRLNDINKFLRVVLEPQSPINKMTLPKGPTYVMMAYNLYGYHSGPGPKADNLFIRKLASRFDAVPGDKYMAFATGGFDWGADGKVTALTEKQAVELLKKSINTPKRDSASGSIYFSYIDDLHIKHTVWYADDTTLAQWFNLSSQLGYSKIAIWRLGDMEQATLRYLNNICR